MGQIVLLAARRAPGRLHDAPPLKASELGAARARLETRPVSNFFGSGRLPQLGKREIDPSFLGREQFEMTFEVLRVIIDQVEQIGHQVAKGSARSETGHDHHEAGVATGQDL